MAPTLFVGLEADSTEPGVRELGEILRRLDLQFRKELFDREHHDSALVENAIHEDVVNLEFSAERLALPFRLLQLLRVRFEGDNLLLERRGLPFEEMPCLPFRVELRLETFQLRLRLRERSFRRPEVREFRFEGGTLRLECLALDFQVRKPRAHIANLAHKGRQLIEPLPFRGFLKDGLADALQPFLVRYRVRDGVELPKGLDLRVVEGSNESMAIVRLPPKVPFELLQLPLVFRQDERVLVDRSDFLVDAGEGLFRARLFLAQLADELHPVGEPL